jgi:hypothetical protein
MKQYSVTQQQQIGVNGIQIPKPYEETMKSPQRDERIAAMQVEINDIKRKKLYSLVKRPDKAKILGGKWIYLIKTDEDGEILRYEARWVVQGFRQRKGIDYSKNLCSSRRRIYNSHNIRCRSGQRMACTTN